MLSAAIGVFAGLILLVWLVAALQKSGRLR